VKVNKLDFKKAKKDCIETVFFAIFFVGVYVLTLLVPLPISDALGITNVGLSALLGKGLEKLFINAMKD